MRLSTLRRIRSHKRRSPAYIAAWHEALQIKHEAPETVATVSDWYAAIQMGNYRTRRDMYYYRRRRRLEASQ